MQHTLTRIKESAPDGEIAAQDRGPRLDCGQGAGHAERSGRVAEALEAVPDDAAADCADGEAEADVVEDVVRARVARVVQVLHLAVIKSGKRRWKMASSKRVFAFYVLCLYAFSYFKTRFI